MRGRIVAGSVECGVSSVAQDAEQSPRAVAGVDASVRTRVGEPVDEHASRVVGTVRRAAMQRVRAEEQRVTRLRLDGYRIGEPCRCFRDLRDQFCWYRR